MLTIILRHNVVWRDRGNMSLDAHTHKQKVKQVYGQSSLSQPVSCQPIGVITQSNPLYLPLRDAYIHPVAPLALSLS